MDLKLRGRRALVTGANKSIGIGSGIAKVLLEEGAQVVIHGRDVERTRSVAEELRQYGEVMVATGDLTTDEGADATAKAALEAFGGIDILVNNAGSAGYKGYGFFNIAVKDWTMTHGMNVISAVNMIHRLTPQMQERRWGRIIMMGSFSAQSNLGNNLAYNTTKAAISNLTLGLAKTLKNTGITVNTVSPGIIVTENLEAYFQKVADREGFDGPHRRELAIQWLLDNMLPQTVARLGVPEDVAHICAFLCGPQADFISAANFRVDGGASPSVN